MLLWHVIVFLVDSNLVSASINGHTKHRREVIFARNGAVASDDRWCSRIGKDVLVELKEGMQWMQQWLLLYVWGLLVQLLVALVVEPLCFSGYVWRQCYIESKRWPISSSPWRTCWPSQGVEATWEASMEKTRKATKILTRRGFKISPYLHTQMKASESDILADAGLRSIFAPNGKLLNIGGICYNKKLAYTLRAISKHGPQAFYSGLIGRGLVRDVKKAGGILTMKDLKSYTVKQKEPLSTDVLGLKILGMPPPSGGPPMVLLLNILAQYELPSGLLGSIGIHREIEALKHVFAVRMNLGDPDFVNITAVLSDLLSPKFAKKLKKDINDNKTYDLNHYGGKWNQILDHGTSHVSIIDLERNAISMTATINAYFGSKINSRSTGIVLNNEMDDFSMPRNVSKDVPPPAPANFVAPGKPQGSGRWEAESRSRCKWRNYMIIAGTSEVLLNHFVKGLDPLSSVLAPRVYHQLIPNVVNYENWTTVTGDHFELPADIREALKRKGHVLQGLAGGTICQFIVQDIGKLVAVSDPRKGGLPAGF
ncbi:hypothetical protein RIF29_08708 [Crotalaria pallida]|uniref:Uncharacterized protein n=1 Tax=Crotalaria pallida TaxID=3830 RepID=A0AAN9FXK1_CROPI